jgi:hypothetical protein
MRILRRNSLNLYKIWLSPFFLNLQMRVTIVDTIHRHSFYVKLNLSETGFYLSAGGTYPVSEPETETVSICWAQLSTFHLKTETDSSPKRCVLNKR